MRPSFCTGYFKGSPFVNLESGWNADSKWNLVLSLATDVIFEDKPVVFNDITKWASG
jgi:hypothetical protein